MEYTVYIGGAPEPRIMNHDELIRFISAWSTPPEQTDEKYEPPPVVIWTRVK